MQVTAGCSTEHHIAINPERPSVKPLLDLASSMPAKRLEGKSADFDSAARPG